MSINFWNYPLEFKYPRKFDVLWDLDLWSVGDIFYMLFGGRAYLKLTGSDVSSYAKITNYGITQMVGNFKKDAIAGRFGEFDPNDGDWTYFCTHPLPAIDWFDDRKILEEVDFYPDCGVHPRVRELIEDWNKSRCGIAKLNDDWFKRFAKRELWTLTQFRILLFGEIDSRQYLPEEYNRYNPPIEGLMDQVDLQIKEAMI